MHSIPRFLNIVSAVALIGGIGLSNVQTFTLANLTGGGASVLDRAPVTGGMQLHQAADILPVLYPQVDAGIQLIIGVLLILLGMFLHAFARMQNGERPVHITVKPKKKRQVWYWVEMRI